MKNISYRKMSYVQTLQGFLPEELKTEVSNLPEDQRSLLEAILCFSIGAECPPRLSEKTRNQWSAAQDLAIQALRSLSSRTNGKRTREDDVSDDSHVSKKPRNSPLSSDEADAALYTLHTLSTSSPLRKKLDIRLHERTLRLTNPATQIVEASIPIASLKRAFLLPTRGKTKPHWTVVLLSSDTPAPTGKAAAASPNAKDNVQIVFGVDAVPAPYSTTDHTVDSPSQANHPKGTPIVPFLRAFLSHLPIPTIEPDTTAFRSIFAANGEAIAGVQAYRSAKEGTLWFLPSGVLWDGKPCEYWPCKDLVSTVNAAGEAGTGSDGVRLVSATGRTCSVFLRRRVIEEGSEKDKESGDEEEEIKCVETDFSMIDGKEQDGITQWVKKHKHLFGKDEPDINDAAPYGYVNGKPDLKGKGKAIAPPPPDEDSDEDDSDFVGDSDDEDDSGTDNSDSEGEGAGRGGGSGGDESGSGSGSGSEDGDEDQDENMDAMEDADEDAPLDPAHHPLLRPGAMPRMSKAAMDAAIGMVTQDMLGGGSVVPGGAVREADSEDEEDELED